jgi:hypothetical protein
MSKEGMLARGKKYYDLLQAGLDVPKQVADGCQELTLWEAHLASLKPKAKPKPKAEPKKEEGAA